MPRAVVVGGRGFYGQMVVEEARRYGWQVDVAGRSGPVRLDLNDPSSFGGVSDHDVVLNASDTIRADPTTFAEHVLRTGGLLVELGAEPALMERLLALDVPDARGVVLAGPGSFPGVSTACVLSALTAARAGDLDGTPLDVQSIDLAVRISPLSGGGSGIVALMMAMMETPGLWWEAGERREGPAVGPARVFEFEAEVLKSGNRRQVFP